MRRDLLELNTGKKDPPGMILEMIDRADQNPEAIQILGLGVNYTLIEGRVPLRRAWPKLSDLVPVTIVLS